MARTKGRTLNRKATADTRTETPRSPRSLKRKSRNQEAPQSRDLSQSSERRQVRPSVSKNCPDCFSVVPEPAATCYCCGHRFIPMREHQIVACSIGAIVTVHLGASPVLNYSSDNNSAILFFLFSLTSVVLPYLLGGVLIGLFVAPSRIAPQIFCALGATALNEYFWPSNSGLVLNVSLFFVTMIWAGLWIHMGAWISRRFGWHTVLPQVPPERWYKYVQVTLLVVSISLMTAVVGTLIGKGG